MPRHPIDGVKGSKPKLKPAGKTGEITREEASQLSEEFIRIRNRSQAAKAEIAEIALQEKKGTLISKKLAGFQAAYLMTIFRQRVLAAPPATARRLVSLGLVTQEHERQVGQALRQEACAQLTELATLPGQITDPNWVEKIDPDFLAQADGERPMPPSEIKHEQERAKRRREKKTQSMRRLRAAGRTA